MRLDAARPVLERVGAVPFGVPGIDATPAVRRTATFGWASLTGRELEVVRLPPAGPEDESDLSPEPGA